MKSGSSARNLSRMLIIIGSVAVVVVLVLFFQSGQEQNTSGKLAMAAENRLAILYFDNARNANDEQRLGEMTTSLLIADLGVSKYMSLTPIEQIYDIRKNEGKEGDQWIDKFEGQAIAKQVNAKWVLLGTIVQIKPNLVFSMLLIDVATGEEMAAPKVECEEGATIFRCVDQISIEIKKLLPLPTEALSEPDPRVSELTTYYQKAYTHYLEGMDLMRRVQWGQALRSFNDALRVDSSLVVARYNLAVNRFYFTSGQLSRKMANEVYEFVRNADEKHQLLIEAIHHIGETDYDAAVEVLQNVTRLYPLEKQAFTLEGSIRLLCQMDPAGAIGAYEQALALDSTDRLAHKYLTYAYYENGEIEKALEISDRYVSTMPLEVDPFVSRGDLMAFSGDADEAGKAYQQAIAGDTENPFYRQYQGTMALYRGKYKNAKRNFDYMANSRRRLISRKGHTFLSWVTACQGNFEASLKELDRGIKLDEKSYGKPKSSEKHVQKAFIYREQGNSVAALAEMENALQTLRYWKKTEYNLWDTQIELLTDMGRYGPATKLANALRDSIMANYPGQLYRSYYATGYIALARNQYDAAIIQFEEAAGKALHMTGKYSIVRLALGRAYLGAGRTADAIAEFEKAATTCEPDLLFNLFSRIKAKYYLGMAYETAGQADKAIEQYQSIVELWPAPDKGILFYEDTSQRLARLQS